MFDAAWAVVRKHGLSPVLKDELARASEATHPREALEVYAERVVRLSILVAMQLTRRRQN